MPKNLLTAKDVLDYLNITKGDLVSLIRNENMPFIRIGGQARFRPEDLEPWLEAKRISTRSDPDSPGIIEAELNKYTRSSVACDEISGMGNMQIPACAIPAAVRSGAASISDRTSDTSTNEQNETYDPLPITDPYLIYQDGNALALKIFSKQAARHHVPCVRSIISALYPELSSEHLICKALDTPGQPVELGLIPERLESAINVIVTSDRQYAFYYINRDKFVTASGLGEELLWILAEMKICNGLDARAVSAAGHPDAPGKIMPAARGTLPKSSGKAELDVRFNTPRTFKPKDIEKQDSDPGFTASLTVCRKGDLLAAISAPVLSRNGVDVYGNIVTPDGAKGSLLKSGPNTYFSRDKSRVHASCDGIPYWRGGVICVDNTVILDGAGYDTGNVQAEGRVVIQGNVESGFSVEALRKVIIKGQMDAAHVRSRKSSVSVRQGIHGNDKASVKAGASIHASFATGCTLEACMNIIVDTSMVRCNARAFKNICLKGDGSRVVSSVLSAGRSISVGSCGTKSQLRTILRVQIPADDGNGFEKNRLEQQINETRTKISQQKSRIFRLREQKSSAVEVERRRLEALEEWLRKEERAMEAFYQWIKDSETIFIDVRETAWPGTVIGIEDREFKVKKPLQSQRFYYTHSGIKHRDI